MKKTVLILYVLALFALVATVAEAGPMRTPYGDSCGKCSRYGICKDFLSIEESSEAVKNYFDNTEIVIGHVRGNGRFLKMELIKGKEIYDVILFDRKTGRIRSIY